MLETPARFPTTINFVEWKFRVGDKVKFIEYGIENIGKVTGYDESTFSTPVIVETLDGKKIRRFTPDGKMSRMDRVQALEVL